MLTEDLVDVPIDVFGGYCPAIVPSDLPPGAANIAQDVMFPQGGVRTRGGLGDGVAFSPLSAVIPAGDSINGLKTYITPTGGLRLLIWTQLGNLFKENPQGTLSLINSRPYTGLFAESQTLFGREYQAFFNSAGGFDIPRQYDDTNWDRVSQVGPGAGPVVANFNPANATLGAGGATAINIAAGPGGIVWGGSQQYWNGHFYQTLYTYFTVTTTSAHGFSVNQRVTIAGSTSTPSVNQSWTVGLILSSTSFRVYSTPGTQFPVGGGGGTVQDAASVAVLSRVNGIVTASTTAAHGFQAGWQVQISGVGNTSLGGAITSIARTATGLVTVVTTSAHGFSPGNAVGITGVTDTSFNGNTTVVAVLSATSFTYQQSSTTVASSSGGNAQDIWNGIFLITSVPSTTTFAYADPGPTDSTTNTGTAAILPLILPGLHQVSVAFITRQGFITQPANPVSFYASGVGLTALSQIATGPPNVAARLLIFTPVITAPATTGSFYSITSTATGGNAMLINDNVTTAAVIDFNEAVLASSFACTYLFTQLELGESAFFIPYNSRGVWLGERSKVPNFYNLTFDGGFNGTTPNFWTLDPANGAGGSSAVAGGLPADWADAYVITGDGATAIRGKITQSAYQDYLGVAIIQQNTSYSVRVRLRYAGTAPAQGTFHINLQSTIGGFTTAGLAIAANTLTQNFQEFTAALTNAPLANPPSDLLLQVYVDGTLTNGSQIIIDSIEPYATSAPVNSSIARFSHAFNMESFDSVTGQVTVRSGDGQQLRAGFPLRNSLYLAKDHYLGYVTDDGVNEPANWQFTEVSATVGICGPNAVDWMEEWAVFAERSGFYICWGSDPVKITPEIQTDATHTGRVSWASINWTAAYTMWVRIDKVNKQILIGAPINGATTPNVVFMLDYQWLVGAEDIASSPLVTYSQFTGKILAHGRGRRWAIWNISANSMCFAERADGTAQPFFGGVGNGKIFWQQDVTVQAYDNANAIASQYQTYPAPSSQEEQMYQLRAHQKLLGYLKFRAIGSGTLNLALSTAQRSTILRGYTLSANPAGDGERPVNIKGERFFITASTNAAGSWFQLDKLIPCMKKAATAMVRGVSS